MDKKSKLNRLPATPMGGSVPPEVEIAIADIMFEARDTPVDVPAFVRIGDTDQYVVAVPASWAHRTLEEIELFLNMAYVVQQSEK